MVEAKTGSECTNFRNGDHTTTMIRTENGKVIEIQHNVMTPQPYNRLYQLDRCERVRQQISYRRLRIGS